MKRTLIALSLVCLAACSSGSGSGGSRGGSDLTSFCEQLAARDETCGNQPGDVESCKADYGALEKNLRMDMLPALYQCLSERDCQTSDDSCYASVGQNAPPSALRDVWEQKCLAKVAACVGELSNDLCTDGDIPWRLFSDAVYQEFTPCFDQPTCAGVEACLEA